MHFIWNISNIKPIFLQHWLFIAIFTTNAKLIFNQYPCATRVVPFVSRKILKICIGKKCSIKYTILNKSFKKNIFINMNFQSSCLAMPLSRSYTVKKFITVTPFILIHVQYIYRWKSWYNKIKIVESLYFLIKIPNKFFCNETFNQFNMPWY